MLQQTLNLNGATATSDYEVNFQRLFKEKNINVSKVNVPQAINIPKHCEHK